MVSTYYFVKLFQKATQDRNKRNLDGCEEDSLSSPSPSTLITIESGDKCRICLKKGTIPIFSETKSHNISVSICTFGGIDVSQDDDYPKHLCDACNKLLQAAILFRKTAEMSDQILKKQKLIFENDSNSFQALEMDNNIVENIEEKTKSTELQKYFTIVSSDIEDYNVSEVTQKIKRRKKITKVQCRICLKIITKAYYREHYALHDSSISKYMCDICGKSFRQHCSFRNHYFTHSTDFPYKCNICPYKGRNSGLLNTHMRTHSGDYRYMCTDCPARFLTKSNLNKHSLKHKEPMYKCETCRRAFHSKLILERHFEADHLGIKKHICNMCGKAFGYRKAMMRHQVDVHKREKKLNGRTPAYLEAELKIQENEAF